MVGNTWNIVDVTSLSATFGGTFDVVSLNGAFSEAGGIWTRMENSVEYQFDTSSGLLSVIPEPSAAFLLGLGVMLLWGLRNRRPC